MWLNAGGPDLRRPATGRTGRRITDQALDAGHSVTALVRDPARITLVHERWRAVAGDVADPGPVSEVIEDQDAVLVAPGPAPRSPSELVTEGVRHIVGAMRRNGVRRVVRLSGAAIDSPGDRKRLSDRFFARVIRLLSRRDVLAKESQYRLLRDTDLDWTLVRPPRLTKGPAKGEYRLGTQRLEGRAVISRAGVAAFMLREAVEGRHLRQAPFIGG